MIELLANLQLDNTAAAETAAALEALLLGAGQRPKPLKAPDLRLWMSSGLATGITLFVGAPPALCGCRCRASATAVAGPLRLQLPGPCGCWFRLLCLLLGAAEIRRASCIARLATL
jgi:hypothetical protein